jgi:tol-pal system protein YbgF
MWHDCNAMARRVAFAGAVILSLITRADAEGSATFEWLGDRLDAAEDRVAQVARGLGLAKQERPVVEAQFGAGGQSATQLTVRMDTLEAHMRQLTGQVEQLMFQIRQVDDRLKRVAEDTEFRFREMSGSGRSASPNTQQPRPRSEATPPQGTVSQANQPPQQSAPPTQTTVPTQSPSTAAGPQLLGQVPLSAETSAPGGSATGRPLDLAAVIRGNGLPGEPPLAAMPSPGATPSSGTAGGQLAAAPNTSPKDEFDLAYSFILRQDYELAETSFREFLTRHPNDQMSGNAQFWLGEAQFQRGKYREAADAYLKVYTQFGSSAKAPESLLKLGVSLRQLKENEAACAALTEFGRRYPKASPQLRQQAQAEQQRAGCS